MRGVLLFLVAACAAVPRADDPMHSPLEVTLKVGQTVSCGRDATLHFQAVLQDSRCPEGANCVWAGNARVALTVRRASKDPVTIELNTNLEPKAAEISDLAVELIDLRPTRRVGEELDKSAYVVTLRVTDGSPRP
jgi:hypothetical protein